MVKLKLDIESKPSFQILCLGAHCDDIEIGCGGTILKLIELHENLAITWVVFSSDPRRAQEAMSSAEGFLEKATSKEVIIKDFRDSYFPYYGREIKEDFEHLKQSLSPDLIFTHHRNDLHQDHRLICELTWNAFRDQMIMEYEIPKYDGDLGCPNVYVPLDDQISQCKVYSILDHYKSQASKNWFTEDTFFSLLRLRGIEAGNSSRYAEAFYCRKMIL